MHNTFPAKRQPVKQATKEVVQLKINKIQTTKIKHFSETIIS